MFCFYWCLGPPIWRSHQVTIKLGTQPVPQSSYTQSSSTTPKSKEANTNICCQFEINAKRTTVASHPPPEALEALEPKQRMEMFHVITYKQTDKHRRTKTCTQNQMFMSPETHQLLQFRKKQHTNICQKFEINVKRRTLSSRPPLEALDAENESRTKTDDSGSRNVPYTYKQIDRHVGTNTCTQNQMCMFWLGLIDR